MSKVWLGGIFRAYIGTLRNDATRTTSVADVFVQILLPAIVSIAYGVLRVFGVAPVGCGSVSANIITIVSIVSALLCGVAVMVFQLRVDIIGSKVERGALEREMRLVDEVYADMLWAIVAGFAVAALLTLRGMVSHSVVDCAITAVALFLFINFCLVVCMCLKRMGVAYDIVSKYWSRLREDEGD